jgi:hypothetical protein
LHIPELASSKCSWSTCRDGYGIDPIVKMLEMSKNMAVTGAAADAIRAVALNNDANKNAVREAWALPLLVKLLGPGVSPEPLPSPA